MWRAKVARVAKNVTLKNQETKCYEYTGINSAFGGTKLSIPLFSNAGAATGVASPFVDLPLDNIDQGTARNQRIGNHITLKGMHMKLNMQVDPNLTFHTLVRIVLAWTDPNFASGTFTNSSLLVDSATAGSNVIHAQLRGPTEPDTRLKRVLMDRVFDLRIGNQPFNAGTAIPQIVERHIKLHVPFHNKKYQFISGTTGIGGEFEDLHMFVWGYAPSQPNTSQVATLLANNRIYYKDG